MDWKNDPVTLAGAWGGVNGGRLRARDPEERTDWQIPQLKK